jgi:hypothetical protein
MFEPSVVVEWLTLLLRIREIPGSNLCPSDRLSLLRLFVVSASPYFAYNLIIDVIDV